MPEIPTPAEQFEDAILINLRVSVQKAWDAVHLYEKIGAMRKRPRHKRTTRLIHLASAYVKVAAAALASEEVAQSDMVRKFVGIGKEG